MRSRTYLPSVDEVPPIHMIKKDSGQQPDASNVLCISWCRNTTDAAIRMQANRSRGTEWSGRFKN